MTQRTVKICLPKSPFDHGLYPWPKGFKEDKNRSVMWITGQQYMEHVQQLIDAAFTGRGELEPDLMYVSDTDYEVLSRLMGQFLLDKAHTEDDVFYYRDMLRAYAKGYVACKKSIIGVID